jgi:hypothetical protein
MSATAPPPAQSQAVISGLTRGQLHELYYWMRLTRRSRSGWSIFTGRPR